MPHPAILYRFPICTFPYLNTIWRTNSYSLIRVTYSKRITDYLLVLILKRTFLLPAPLNKICTYVKTLSEKKTLVSLTPISCQMLYFCIIVFLQSYIYKPEIQKSAVYLTFKSINFTDTCRFIVSVYHLIC